MITLYKKNTRNITSLLYGFHDCREIKIYRKICKKELIKKFQRNFLRSNGFYTVQFLEKFTIDHKKFFWIFAIDRFILCTISGKNCDRSQNFKGVFCDRSLYLLFITVHFLYSEFCDRSQKIPLKFCDRSQIFSRNCTENKPIDCKNSKEFFAIDRFIYCSLMFIFCIVNFAIDLKKFLWNFAIDRNFFQKLYRE